MKFLVIGKPIVSEHAEFSTRSVGSSAQSLRSMASDGQPLEKAYAIISGGFVLIVNANDTVELGTIVRSNPLFKTCHVEITPIADAHDFLEAFATR